MKGVAERRQRDSSPISLSEEYEECGWKVRGKDGAAERLRLKRSTLQSRMKKLGIRRSTA
jgi:transcriptional regulator with GAF, ATPase, and Fis domain